MLLYILDANGDPVAVDDPIEWAKWFEADPVRHRRVRHTQLTDDIVVSTVFLGIDHSWGFRSPAPVLWETMIFGGEHDGYQDRYASRADAIKGHAKAVRLAGSGVQWRIVGNGGNE